MKKAPAFILALLLFVQLTACGSGDTQSGKTDGTATSQTDSATTADPNADSLPDTDLNGFEYRILSFAYWTKTIYADTKVGSVVDDSVYKRNKNVEDRFNCKIVLHDQSVESNIDYSIIRTSILAGEDAFDITMAHEITLANMSLEGLFVNMRKLPYFDFTKPWWPSEVVDMMTVGDKMYLMSN